MSGSPVVIVNTVDPERIETIPRYSMMERVNHWLGGVAYIYLLITGLAFWSPYLFWMTAIVGGGPTARFMHPILGLIFFASMLWMFVDWRGDMQSIPEDEVWKENVSHYIRNEDENLPPIGRFNYGQKLFFWLMLYGAVLLVLSGLVLWFPQSIPWSLRWLRYLAVAIHVTAALATIGGFIIHVYMGTAMVRGGFTSIIRGEVSAAWARLHHRLWYEQVTKKRFEEQ